MVNETGFVPIDLSMWTIAVEKCELCGYSRRPFYCKDCIKSGNFSYSTSLYHRPPSDVTESILRVPYSVKFQKWQELKKKNEALRTNIEKAFNARGVYQRNAEFEEKKNDVEILKKALEMLQGDYQTNKSNLSTMRQNNQKTLKDTMLVRNKITKITEHLEGLMERLSAGGAEVVSSKDKLAENRRCLIEDLVIEIFPIAAAATGATSDSCDSLANSTHQMVNLLRDATRTAYIQGRWVYADSGWDQMYQVLTASLPGNGDYSGYRSTGDTMETIRSPGELQNNPSVNVTSGLSFLNQMVQVIAHILDIKLPFRVPPREFFRTDLTDELFSRAVSRVNKNVATLCFYQNVDRKKLHGLHTVVNVLSLVRTPTLGCDLPQKASTRTSQEGRSSSLPVGDSIFGCYDDDFEDENDEEEVHAQPRPTSDKDWEYVPNMPPDSGATPSSSDNQQSYFSSAVAPTAGVTSIVSSLWKAFSGSGDK